MGSPTSVAQITATGFVGCPPHDSLALKKEFAKKHWVILRDFFEASLLKLFLKKVNDSPFITREDPGIGVEHCLKNRNVVSALRFLMNDPKLFAFIERLTGCPRLGCFDGRVYRMIPGEGDYDSWHDDLIDNRAVAFSMNLSTRSYSGGILRIRNNQTGQVLQEVANPRMGDAILFRLRADLDHMPTEVTGENPKTAFAGWFRTEPHFTSIFNLTPLKR